MVQDLDGPKEPAERVAERRWRNQQIRQKIKEGKTLVPVMVYPEDIDYVNKRVKVDKNPLSDAATVLENKARRGPGGFERKFLKEVRAVLDERKRENYIALAAHVHHYRRRLMLEKLRRLTLSIAESEKRIALRQKHADEGQLDLFAPEVGSATA
jgi:hypothetical protein